MTATPSSIRTDRPERGAPLDAVRRLRALLAFDAATCIALGTVLLVADRFVARVTGLPEPLLVDAGIVLLAFAACVAWATTRRVAGRMAVLLIVDANVVWAVASVVFATWFADGATPLGRAVVIAQGVAVAALAALEHVASRRAARQDVRRGPGAAAHAGRCPARRCSPGGSDPGTAGANAAADIRRECGPRSRTSPS